MAESNPSPRTPTEPDATIMLNKMSQGDPEAAKQLFGWLYAELRQLARGHVARNGAHATQQATAMAPRLKTLATQPVRM